MIWEDVKALKWLLGRGGIALDMRETLMDPVDKLASLLAQENFLSVCSAPNHNRDELFIHKNNGLNDSNDIEFCRRSVNIRKNNLSVG